MTTAEMLLRLAAGVGLGTVIGFERQYRARMAGLRTNALVAAGATLFVLLSAHGFTGAGADPTRVAAQIVSGIGFLGAGVILREGLTVRGLNTAATLWCSAAVGSLAGAGLYLTAVAGTAVVVAVNVALRPLGPRGRPPPRHPRRNPRRLHLPCGDPRRRGSARPQPARAGRCPARTSPLQSIESVNAATVGQVEVRAALSAEQRDDKQMESAVSRLSLEPSVTSVRWQVTNPDHDDVEDR